MQIPNFKLQAKLQPPKECETPEHLQTSLMSPNTFTNLKIYQQRYNEDFVLKKKGDGGKEIRNLKRGNERAYFQMRVSHHLRDTNLIKSELESETM